MKGPVNVIGSEMGDRMEKIFFRIKKIFTRMESGQREKTRIFVFLSEGRRKEPKE